MPTPQEVKKLFLEGCKSSGGGSLWMESNMISCPDVNNWHRVRLTSQTSKSPPPPATHSNRATTLRTWQFTSVYVKRWDKCLSCSRKHQSCNEWHTVGYFSGWPCDCSSPPVLPCRSAWSVSAFFPRLISDSPADTLQSRKWEAQLRWEMAIARTQLWLPLNDMFRQLLLEAVACVGCCNTTQ